MKTKLLVFFLMMLAFSCKSSKTEAEIATESKEYKTLKSLVASRLIRFSADEAYPFQTNDLIQVSNELMRQTENANGRFSLSANEDYLEIRTDSVKAKLTYFGELRTAAYADTRDTNIKFQDKITDLKVTENEKKRTITMTFKARNATEQFNVKLLLFPNGTANVFIYGSNRTAIKYRGKLLSLK